MVENFGTRFCWGLEVKKKKKIEKSEKKVEKSGKKWKKVEKSKTSKKTLTNHEKL